MYDITFDRMALMQSSTHHRPPMHLRPRVTAVSRVGIRQSLNKQENIKTRWFDNTTRLIEATSSDAETLPRCTAPRERVDMYTTVHHVKLSHGSLASI